MLHECFGRSGDYPHWRDFFSQCFEVWSCFLKKVSFNPYLRKNSHFDPFLLIWVQTSSHCRMLPKMHHEKKVNLKPPRETRGNGRVYTPQRFPAAAHLVCDEDQQLTAEALEAARIAVNKCRSETEELRQRGGLWCVDGSSIKPW